jgi:hypothetical protein
VSNDRLGSVSAPLVIKRGEGGGEGEGGGFRGMILMEGWGVIGRGGVVRRAESVLVREY